MIAPIKLAWLLPSNALLPREHLVEHRPEGEDVRSRASASLPSNCSGAIY